MATLKQAAKGMAAVTNKIKDIKHAIRIAAKAAALGVAIATGNVPVIVSASAELITEIDA